MHTYMHAYINTCGFPRWPKMAPRAAIIGILQAILGILRAIMGILGTISGVIKYARPYAQNTGLLYFAARSFKHNILAAK